VNTLHMCVPAAAAGQRLDRVLGQELTGISRAALQKAIKAGYCRVDGLTQNQPDCRLREGQVVELQTPEASSSLRAEEGHLEILWHDEHLAVCNKPAGLTVHPCPSCPEHTLVQRLLARFPQLAKLEGLRPGIVHRLDKDTSGLLAVALTEADRLALSAAFAGRVVHKEYLALVWGRPADAGECRKPLGRHPTAKVKRAVLPEARGGKPAHTAWRRLWSAPDGRCSLLAVRIFTGRTHQIRVHLAHVGHPLLGDRLYAPKNVRALAPRQMLHAWRLELPHPVDGALLRFSCPPPEDLLETALAATRRMRRMVITGSPGSGKSALTENIAATGVPAISADALVARLYAPDGAAGPWLDRMAPDAGILTAQGGVDKAALLAAMRDNPGLRREVEQLVHGLVRAAVEEFWNAAEAAGHALAVAEVPLYFESGWQDVFSPAPLVVGVHCPKELRDRRIRATRGWADDKLAALESWQWPEPRKLAACDLVVDNTGDREALRTTAQKLLQDIAVATRADEAARAREIAALWQ